MPPIGVTLLLLTFALAPHQPALAQGNERTADEARALAVETFGQAGAAEFIVGVCNPFEADPFCEGSSVLAAWDQFLSGVAEGGSVAEVTGTMRRFDEYLVKAIAVYWCSPEPGSGCGSDEFTRAWSSFESLVRNDPDPARAISKISASYGEVIGQLVAASVCEEPSCFAAGEQVATMKFDTKPKRSEKELRKFLCSKGILKEDC